MQFPFNFTRVFKVSQGTLYDEEPYCVWFGYFVLIDKTYQDQIFALNQGEILSSLAH